MYNSEIRIKIKSSKLIRILAFPVVNAIRIFRLLTYRFTEDAVHIRNLKDSHCGERCFIIGNGPSLKATDLDLLSDEYCFASNRIYKMFTKTSWRPQCFLCMDSNVFLDMKHVIEDMGLPLMMVHLEAKKYHLKNKQLIYANNYYPYLVNQYKRIKVSFSADIAKYYAAGETVTYNAIQLAVYMGFKEIYLLGVDHCYAKTLNARGEYREDASIKNYFGDLKNCSYSIQNYDTVNAAYREARRYCEENGVVIRNATRGGKLEIFERVTLENILKSNREEENKEQLKE